MRSIIVDDMGSCIICGSRQVNEHHCIHGSANRKKSEKHRLIIPLCVEHHTGDSGPHRNIVVDTALKCWAQSVYEQKIGTREEFRREFGKSYL